MHTAGRVYRKRQRRTLPARELFIPDGRRWTNSKISIHTAEYDCSIFSLRKI